MLGVVLRCAAIRHLGPWFLDHVALAPRQPMVTDGIYGVMRHPSEAGSICLAMGSVFVLQSFAGLAMGGWLAALVIWRVRLEDRMLPQRFRSEFVVYATRVPALFPDRPRNLFGESTQLSRTQPAD